MEWINKIFLTYGVSYCQSVDKNWEGDHCLLNCRAFFLEEKYKSVSKL